MSEPSESSIFNLQFSSPVEPCLFKVFDIVLCQGGLIFCKLNVWILLAPYSHPPCALLAPSLRPATTLLHRCATFESTIKQINRNVPGTSLRAALPSRSRPPWDLLVPCFSVACLVPRPPWNLLALCFSAACPKTRDPPWTFLRSALPSHAHLSFRDHRWFSKHNPHQSLK